MDFTWQPSVGIHEVIICVMHQSTMTIPLVLVTSGLIRGVNHWKESYVKEPCTIWEAPKMFKCLFPLPLPFALLLQYVAYGSLG